MKTIPVTKTLIQALKDSAAVLLSDAHALQQEIDGAIPKYANHILSCLECRIETSLQQAALFNDIVKRYGDEK